jgi:hypothetical protein
MAWGLLSLMFVAMDLGRGPGLHWAHWPVLGTMVWPLLATLRESGRR